MEGEIMNNSEILYIYDAKQCNPNGDMDNQNKPRMDYDRMINLSSDVRLKRYIRDFSHVYEGEELFITDEAEDSKERGEQIKKLKKEHKDLIDIRLFGAVFAESGANTHLTGPIQFTWGYSLNKVELEESKTITSSFNSGEGIGKDFRVKYSLLAYSGSLNAKIGGKTNLSDKDVNLFDKAMIKAIPLCRTRSKIGQMPRLYLRIELKDNNLFLKDLREYISLEKTEDLYSIKDVKLDISKLKEYLENNKDKIKKVFYYIDDMLMKADETKLNIKDIFDGDVEELDDKYFESMANKYE